MEKNKNILIYRIVVVALSWFTIFSGWIISIVETGDVFVWFTSFRYYTMQTNLMVSIWWTLAIIWYNKPEKLKKLMGNLKGAITLYITVTFVIFAILLAPLYQPTGFAAFSNIMLHYLTPIAFIVDFLLTETEVEYQWKFLIYWVSYPLCYLIFAMVHGAFTGNYLYPFLSINLLGIPIFIISIGFLVVFFLGVGSLYIVINRKRMKR